MKKLLFFLVAVFCISMINAQDKEGAELLVSEGVKLHDKGDYTGAIKKYDEALSLDKDNLLALAEKSLSLISAGRNEDCISCCRQAIETHPGAEDLKMVYVSMGTAYDELGRPKDAIIAYDEGIAVFPEYYLLQYNKGITYIGMEENEKSLECFYKSVMFNPRHASSHNAIARIMQFEGKRIPALLAYFRFLILEPEGLRAKENHEQLIALINSGVKKTGKKSVTISINMNMLGDTTEDGKPVENSFSMVDMLLSMDAALDSDKKNKKSTQIELFIRKAETMFSVMKESAGENSGFFWDYYVPYFVALKDAGYMEVFGNLIFISSGDEDALKWVEKNSKSIDNFYSWSASFDWYYR